MMVFMSLRVLCSVEASSQGLLGSFMAYLLSSLLIVGCKSPTAAYCCGSQ